MIIITMRRIFIIIARARYLRKEIKNKNNVFSLSFFENNEYNSITFMFIEKKTFMRNLPIFYKNIIFERDNKNNFIFNFLKFIKIKK